MPLHPILPDFPFSKWGLEFVGPINHPSSTGHIFSLTAKDYFTKWIEVVPLKRAQYEQIIFFLETNIFSHFGLPIVIIFYNGLAFIFGKLTEIINKFGVKNFTSSTQYP
jgi:hypothetical protein